MKWVLPMKFFQDSLETFFLNVFNSSVPAYSGDDSHTRATIVRELREKYPGCINGYQSGRDIIDYDGVYRANSWQVDVEAAERQMINEIIETWDQAVAAMAPDYYPIVDGEWLATYANLQKTGIPHYATEQKYLSASEWFESTRGKQTLSITRGRHTYWIWSDGNVFLLVGGGRTALIMTRAQMDVQVFVNMIAPPITTYSYGNSFINWSSYPFNSNKIVQNPPK